MHLSSKLDNFKKIVLENKTVTGSYTRAAFLAIRQRYFSQRKTLYKDLTFKKLSFEARFCDWIPVREVLFEKEYDFVPKLLGNETEPIVIDAGANIGTFALSVFADFPKAKIFSFEAEPETAQILSQNAKLNPKLYWKIYPEALWSACGEVIVSDTEWSMSNSVSIGKAKKGETYIKSIDLETVFERVNMPIDMIKIDIEGGEDDFLSGKINLLHDVHFLLLELHPQACNTISLLQELKTTFSRIYRLSRISSAKPLILATNESLNLPLYYS